jgi:hypothetical protein
VARYRVMQKFRSRRLECFHRGSSSGLAWISAEGRIRPKPCGGAAKACGNDGLLTMTAQAAGNESLAIQNGVEQCA